MAGKKILPAKTGKVDLELKHQGAYVGRETN